MDIPRLLRSAKTIAVVGLSDKPERPSYDVAMFLKDRGYSIIPVNPNIKDWAGLKAYGSLLEIPKSVKVDIVDIFRRSEDVGSIVDEAIAIKAKSVWMQVGVADQAAAEKARAAGLFVVMDRCMKIESMRLMPITEFKR